MSELIYFSNVRCSFPNLTQPYVSKRFPASTPTYAIDIIDMPTNHPQVKEFMQQYHDMAMAGWGEKAQSVMQMIQTDRRSRCYGIGAEKINEETGKQYAGYGTGTWINAKNKNRPQIIKANGETAKTDLEAIDLARRIYGGCYVNLVVRPWLRISNKGISCDLVGVQFAAEGVAFGESAPDVSKLFGAVVAPLPSFLNS